MGITERISEQKQRVDQRTIKSLRIVEIRELVHGIWSMMNVLYLNKGEFTESQRAEVLKLKKEYDAFCRDDLERKTVLDKLKFANSEILRNNREHSKIVRSLKSRIKHLEKKVVVYQEALSDAEEKIDHIRDISNLSIFQLLKFKLIRQVIRNY